MNDYVNQKQQDLNWIYRNAFNQAHPYTQHCRCEIHKVVHVLDLMAKFMCKLEAQMADFAALKTTVADIKGQVDIAVAYIAELKNVPDQQPEVDAIVADLAAAVDQLKAALPAPVPDAPVA